MSRKRVPTFRVTRAAVLPNMMPKLRSGLSPPVGTTPGSARRKAHHRRSTSGSVRSIPLPRELVAECQGRVGPLSPFEDACLFNKVTGRHGMISDDLIEPEALRLEEQRARRRAT